MGCSNLLTISERENLKNAFPRGVPFFVSFADTSPAVQAVQFEAYRSMSGEPRLVLAYEMSKFGHELNRARIRREHPECLKRALPANCSDLPSCPRPFPPACDEREIELKRADPPLPHLPYAL